MAPSFDTFNGRRRTRVTSAPAEHVRSEVTELTQTDTNTVTAVGVGVTFGGAGAAEPGT